jgi:PEP-CTERM motif-containing protein
MSVKPMLRVFLVASLAIAAGSADALLLNGSYTVTASSNPSTGLAVGTINDFGSVVNSTTNSFTGLNVTTAGAVHFQDLFDIFATESPPYSGNDLVPQTITVGFTFTSPSAASGVISGTTVGTLSGTGLLHFNNPLTLAFSTNNRLIISLSDAEFGDSFNGVVEAQFTSVPEPATLLLLMAAGGIGLAFRGRRAA